MLSSIHFSSCSLLWALLLPKCGHDDNEGYYGDANDNDDDDGTCKNKKHDDADVENDFDDHHHHHGGDDTNRPTGET